MTTDEKLAGRTERQRQVYEYIAWAIRFHGYPPTIREIGKEFGIRSPNGVLCHLAALKKNGLIATDPLKSRGIRLVVGVTCPHCGERIDRARKATEATT